MATARSSGSSLTAIPYGDGLVGLGIYGLAADPS